MAAKKEWEVSMSGVLLGMGNPLLDISNDVDKELMDKYGLKPGDIILAEEKHQPLFKELSDKEGVKYIAGGATQNSIRVCQWMLQKNNATTYMGCIGKDEYGDKLAEACKSDGVNAVYMIDETTPTGTCATCICDKERALCTNLKASESYKVDHLKANMALLEKAKVVYSAGFFSTHSTESMMLAAKHCNENGKTYCLNLSAPFLMEVPPLKANIEKLLPYVDVLFGNETEAASFAKSWGFSETDIPSIAKKIAALPKEGSKPRTVVITQGCDDTVVVVGEELKTYPIIKINPKKIVDTNAAGDSYVAGFLFGLVQGKDMHFCCQAGAYAASVIIQHSGCTFPAKPRFTYKPPKQPEPLKKPKFGVVGKIQPEAKGLNLMVKVVKEAAKVDDFTEFVIGDKTGIITFSARADQAAICKVDSVLKVQNAKVVMVKGFIRLVVDKWGVVKPVEDAKEIEVKTEKDISATEYELS